MKRKMKKKTSDLHNIKHFIKLSNYYEGRGRNKIRIPINKNIVVIILIVIILNKYNRIGKKKNMF